MFRNSPSRNYNNNLRIFINGLWEISAYKQLQSLISKICGNLKVKKNRWDEEINHVYDTETLLYVLCILFKFKEKRVMRQFYYEILTYLLIRHDQDFYYASSDYLLMPLYILNASCGKVKFQKVPHGLFLETYYGDKSKFEDDIEDYLSLQDFLEINKCIKFGVDRLFGFQTFYKNFKNWPKDTSSLIYKLYFTFLQKDTEEIAKVKKSIKKQSLNDLFYSPSYNFIFILFAIELKRQPDFSTFWNLFIEMKTKFSGYDKKIIVPETLIWVIASFLKWEEFEKVIIKIYEDLGVKLKKEYLNHRIKYFLEIFEKVNNQKVNYTYADFANIWETLHKEQDNQELQAKYPIDVYKPSPTSGGVSSLTMYMQINTTEEKFLSYSKEKKMIFLINFLKNNEFTSFGFDALISVINADKEKKNILNKMKESKEDLKYTKMIIAYFDAQNFKNQLTDIFQNFSKNEKFDTLFSLVISLFKQNYLIVFFTFFYDSFENKFSNFINELFLNYGAKNELDYFQKIYDPLKIIFNNNYYELWNSLTNKLNFFDSYKWTYIRLMSLFIDSDELFSKLNIQMESKYKIDFIKNYIYNIELVILNKWNFKKIYNSENELILWMIFVSFSYWNPNNWEYSYWKYIPWLLEQKDMRLTDKEKEDFFLKLANTTEESLDLKNILHFSNISMSSNLSGQDYCKINLFIAYVREENEFCSFLKYIENNLNFYLSISWNLKIVMTVLDNFLRSNISEIRKNKLMYLLELMINFFKKTADIENTPYFTSNEIKQIKRKEFYYLGDKIIFFILDFHFSDEKTIKEEWYDEKKKNIKLLLEVNHNDCREIILLERYKNSSPIKEKIKLIEGTKE